MKLQRPLAFVIACTVLPATSFAMGGSVGQVFSGQCTLYKGHATTAYAFAIDTKQQNQAWDIPVVRQGKTYLYELSAYNATGADSKFVGFAWYAKDDASYAKDPSPLFLAAWGPALPGVADIAAMDASVGDDTFVNCRGKLEESPSDR
jgi:hypothetical protein